LEFTNIKHSNTQPEICTQLKGLNLLQYWQKPGTWASTSTRWHFAFGVMLPCTDCKSAQQCTTTVHILPFPQVTSRSVQ